MKSILDQDAELIGDPCGWIQHKGSSLCIDMHCKCGYHGHLDSDFCYYYECPSCKTLYEVGSHVRLWEVDRSTVTANAYAIKTCELDHDE